MENLELKELIDSYDVIFFDVFDTLVERVVANPIDIFKFVEKIYNKNSGIKSEFAHKRRNAEKIARRKKQYAEIDLYEIYAEIDLDNKAKEELFRLECQAERDFCYKKAEMFDAYTYAVNSGKNIYVVSDMYLPQGAIAEILYKNGYKNFKKIFVSGEYHITKRSGELFDLILKDEKLDRNSVLHIGNDKIADFQSPSRRGIKSYLYLDRCSRILPYTNKITFKQVDKTEFKAISKFIAYKLSVKSPNKLNLAYRLGYSVFGPLLLGYIKWVHNKIIADKVHTLLFCSRDGYILKKCFDYLYPNEFQTEYFYISRRAIVVPCLKNDRNLKDMLTRYKTWPRSFKFSFLLEKLGISGVLDNLRDVDFSGHKILGDYRLQKKLCNYLPMIHENSRKQSYLLSKYLNILTHGDKRIEIIDSGGNRTIESNLREFAKLESFETEFYGSYLQINGSKDTHSDGFLFSKGINDVIKRNQAFFYYFFEIFLSAPHGSILGYRESSGEVLPIYDDYEYANDKNDQKKIELLQMGALDFTKDFNHLSRYFELSPLSVFQFVYNFGVHPIKADVDFWLKFRFFADEFQNIIVVSKNRTCNPFSILKNMLVDYRKSLWKSGYIAKVLGTSRFNGAINYLRIICSKLKK